MRRIIVDKAAQVLGVPADTLAVRDKSVYSTADPKKKMPLTEAIKHCHFEGIIPQNLATFRAPFTEPITSDAIKDPVFPDFTFGAQAAGPAVANAVADAIGKRITHLPITAERIYFALQEGAVQEA